VLEPALDPAAFETAGALHAAVAATAERHIRTHLDQWCIFRPLWDGAPAADPATEVAARRVEA
jgi:hypothetical protein